MLTRVFRGEFDRSLRDAVLVQDKREDVVSLASPFETKGPLCRFIRDFCPDLRRAFLLTRFFNNFLRREGRRASLIP